MYCKLQVVSDFVTHVSCINSSKVYCKYSFRFLISIIKISINSSKVYCKSSLYFLCHLFLLGINSSKVYCKCCCSDEHRGSWEVLIVAKCIVNRSIDVFVSYGDLVLIVAKCIVNSFFLSSFLCWTKVLIVAKCIVNVYLIIKLALLSTY